MAAPRIQEQNIYADRKHRVIGFCSLSRCCTLIFALFFCVYLIGAGTRDASRNKKQTLRKGPTKQKLQTPPLQTNVAISPPPLPVDDSGDYDLTDGQVDDDASSTIENESEIDNNETQEGETTISDETADLVKKNDDDSQDDIDKSLLPETTFEEDDQALQETINEAILDLDQREEDSLEENESIIADTLKHIESTIMIGLGRIFGNSDDVSEEEIEDLALEITNSLEENVHSEFRSASDAITDSKADQIKETVDRDEEDGIKPKSIRSDVKQVEMSVAEELKKDINKVALEATKNMKAKAAKIEKEAIEKAMAKKKGKNSHKVKIVNDIVERDDSPEDREQSNGDEEAAKDTKGSTSETIKNLSTVAVGQKETASEYKGDVGKGVSDDKKGSTLSTEEKNTSANDEKASEADRKDADVAKVDPTEDKSIDDTSTKKDKEDSAAKQNESSA